MVLDLLAEPIRQAREQVHSDPHRRSTVLPLILRRPSVPCTIGHPTVYGDPPAAVRRSELESRLTRQANLGKSGAWDSGEIVRGWWDSRSALALSRGG